MSEPGPLRRELSELLECPVCLAVPQGRIWGCTNGHTVCGACHGRLSVCPLCRDALSHRQLKLEQLRDRLRAAVGPEIRPPLRETSRLLNGAFVGTPPGDPSPEGGGVAAISPRWAAPALAAAALTPARAASSLNPAVRRPSPARRGRRELLGARATATIRMFTNGLRPNEIRELLQCPVCLEVPRASIWGCDNDHVVCGACYGRMSSPSPCPLCDHSICSRRRNLEKIRNRAEAVYGLSAIHLPAPGTRRASVLGCRRATATVCRPKRSAALGAADCTAAPSAPRTAPSQTHIRGPGAPFRSGRAPGNAPVAAPRARSRPAESSVVSGLEDARASQASASRNSSVQLCPGAKPPARPGAGHQPPGAAPRLSARPPQAAATRPRAPTGRRP